MAPGWIRALILLRGVLPIADQQTSRLMPEFERLSREELEREGIDSVSVPVGAGGRAADAAARERTGGAPAVSP
jgi:hypothetical protein